MHPIIIALYDTLSAVHTIFIALYDTSNAVHMFIFKYFLKYNITKYDLGRGAWVHVNLVPLPCKGRNIVSYSPSTQVTHIQISIHIENNGEKNLSNNLTRVMNKKRGINKRDKVFF